MDKSQRWNDTTFDIYEHHLLLHQNHLDSPLVFSTLCLDAKHGTLLRYDGLKLFLCEFASLLYRSPDLLYGTLIHASLMPRVFQLFQHDKYQKLQ